MVILMFKTMFWLCLVICCRGKYCLLLHWWANWSRWMLKRWCVSCIGKLWKFGRSQVQNGEVGVRICEIWGFSALLPDPGGEGPIDPSKCQEPHIHWHGVACEKTGTVKIWLVTELPVAVFDWSTSNIPTWLTHLLPAHLLTATSTNSATLKMLAVCFSIISEGTKLSAWCTTHKTTRNLNSNCCGSLRTCSVHM
jgi:hypothetical protein